MQIFNLGIALFVWFAVTKLGWAFFTSDLTLEYVASHSRRSAPWWYRVAGLWGGMEGSLLLFAAISCSIIAIASWRESETNLAAAAGGAAALTAITCGLAWPFDTLAVPAVEGFGLTPILEHPAMAIHPPMLYLAMACTFPPLIGSNSKRWLLSALGLLTLSMALGGLWSYVEQGWGGYWAWDPVQNASLAPWLAVLIAIHGTAGRGRRDVALSSLPGVVALAGAASSRSGAVPSVHSFAEAGRIGWALGVLALAAAVFASIRIARRAPTARRLDGWRLTPSLLAGSCLSLVILLTAVPLIGSLGGRNGRLDGRWFSLTLAPFALTAVAALCFLAVRQRGRVPAGGWIAHAGMVILLIGVFGSTLSRSSDGAVATFETATFAGVSVRNEGISVSPGPYPGTSRVTARLSVDGHLVTPSLIAYPERGGVLAETALISRPWRDIQVVLSRADDQGLALIEVRVKPLVELVWLGALIVAIAALVSRRSTRVRTAVSPACEPQVH